MGAGHLEVGDKIRKADGTTGVVKYINTVSETRMMYNLDVAVADTFFVGTQGWLVHNATNDYNYKNRTEAFNAAKDRAGIPRSQQFTKQWEVGNDPKRKGMSNYRYSEDPGTGGRFFQYETPQGPRVVVEHMGDPDKPPHFHAGEPKGNS
ncbi:HNH/endonuclease VII fold putative polymorphic toxin [Deinobacterium chartae]|uniref:HNH/endonuclease VII fold putative polymorphic toxin n=1 Tax=Deinobacterium chartae TaxID=521158 RepID=UPI0031B5EF12